MKIKQLAVALAATGLISTGALAGLPPGEVDDPGGPAPDLFGFEKEQFAAAESLLSIVAGILTEWENRCEVVEDVFDQYANGIPFKIKAFEGVNGETMAYFPDGGLLPIVLEVTPGPFNPDLGYHYEVEQVDNPQPHTEGILGNYSPSIQLAVRDYDGTISYSEKADIMISSAVFQQKYFTLWVDFDEHNIKDFWLADEKGEDAARIKDAGLEVITKTTYPQSKWRQYSDHWRYNTYEEDGVLIPGDGKLYVDKWRITPWGLANILIEMEADVGPEDITGTIDVHCDVLID